MADVTAEHDGNVLRVGEGEFDVFQDAALGTIDFLLRRRVGGKTLDNFEKCLLGVVDGLVGLELCKSLGDAGIVHAVGAHVGGDGFLAVDERLVETAGLRSAENLGGNLKGCRIGMKARGDVVYGQRRPGCCQRGEG